MIKFLHDALRIDTMWYEWIIFVVTINVLIIGLILFNIVKNNKDKE